MNDVLIALIFAMLTGGFVYIASIVIIPEVSGALFGLAAAIITAVSVFWWMVL